MPSSMPQIPAGPQQIANVYQGNPGALQARIQNEQKQKPSVGPDLAKMLALGTVTSGVDASKQAQALQQLQGLMGQSPTGKPPTIFDQLQTKVARMSMGQNQQAQPQAEEAQGLPALAQAPQEEQPVQAAAHGGLMRGHGIDHLPAHFDFAGGGIVAFNKGGDKGEKKDEDEESLASRYGSGVASTAALGLGAKGISAIRDLAARMGTSVGEILATGVKDIAGAGVRGAGHAAKTAFSAPAAAVAAGGEAASQFATDVTANNPKLREAYADNPMLGAMDPNGALASAIIDQGVANTANQKAQAAAQPPAFKPANAMTPQQIERAAAQQSAPAPAPAAPAAKPAGLPGAVAARQPAASPESSDHAYLMGHVKKMLEQDPNAIGEAAAKRNREMLGIDSLLEEKNKRIADRESMIKQQQAGRQPLWLTQLQKFSEANPRAGLGTQLGASGAGTEKVRAEYDEQDLAFNAEINKLKDAVLQAKIEGRYKDAAAYEAALNRVRQEQTSALSSGTSLENASEARKSREQQARDAAAGRAQTAKLASDAKAEALNVQRIKNAETAFDNDPEVKTIIDRAKSGISYLGPQGAALKQSDDARLRQIQASKYKQYGVKMEEAPGAASPGGTTRMRFDAQGNPIK